MHPTSRVSIRRSILPFLCCLVAGLCAGTAFAGTAFHMEEQRPGSDTVVKSRMVVDGKHMRMESGGRSNMLMLFDGANDEMVVVDHDDRSYLVLDEETMKRLGGAVNEAMKQMEAALAQMPPEQRAQMEAMLKQQMGAATGGSQSPPEVRKTGERGTHAGATCTWHEVYRDDALDSKICVADWSAVDGGSDVMATFDEVKDFMESFLAAMSAEGGPLGNMLGNMGQGIMSEMALIDGFPLMTEDWDEGAVVYVTRFAGSEKVDTSAADFEPPAGYKRASMGM